MSFILALLPSVCMILLLFRFHSLCGSIQQLFATNHTSAFFPHPLFFSVLLFFLIHSYITASTATQSFHRTCALPHYNLFASICIPLAFLTRGILLLSLPRSILPRSVCVFVPSCFFHFFALLLSPSSLPILCLSLSFSFPLQSPVMRREKPCNHSNGFL